MITDKDYIARICGECDNTDEIARLLCGHGHFDRYKDYPIPIEAVKHYLRIGAQWQRSIKSKKQ